MSKEPPDKNFASAEEICAAIGRLTDAEAVRLDKAGRYALFGTEFTNPDELLGEAVKRTLEGVGKKHGRHWPKRVDFVAYLIETMRSIADGSRESLVQTETDRLMALAGDHSDEDLVLAGAGYIASDVVEQAIEVEETATRRARAKADADLIDAYFSGDQEVEFLIMGDKEGMKASEIRAMAGMDEKTYDTARRRMRRGLDKLMPGRSQK